MPNIENLEKKPFTKNYRENFGNPLNVQRKDILFREDIRTSFGYAMTGIVVTLAVIGGIYVIGKQLLK
jgi:hypothetical protein